MQQYESIQQCASLLTARDDHKMTVTRQTPCRQLGQFPRQIFSGNWALVLATVGYRLGLHRSISHPGHVHVHLVHAKRRRQLARCSSPTAAHRYPKNTLQQMQQKGNRSNCCEGSEQHEALHPSGMHTQSRYATLCVKKLPVAYGHGTCSLCYASSTSCCSYKSAADMTRMPVFFMASMPLWSMHTLL